MAQKNRRLRVDYAAGGKSIGHIEIGRVQPPPPTAPAISTAAPPPPPAAELYARSELSVGWIKLPASSAELVKEAEKVAAAP